MHKVASCELLSIYVLVIGPALVSSIHALNQDLLVRLICITLFFVVTHSLNLHAWAIGDKTICITE